MKRGLIALVLGLLMGGCVAFNEPADAAVHQVSGPVYPHLKRCPTDEGEQATCVWDAKRMGNRIGDSFIAHPDGPEYLNDAQAHRLAFPHRVRKVEGMGTGHTVAYVWLFDGSYLRVDHCSVEPHRWMTLSRLNKDC